MKKRIILSGLLMLTTFASNAALINSGFEEGDFSSWDSTGNVSVDQTISYGAPGDVNPFEGSFAAHLLAGGTSASDLAATMGITEAVFEASNGGLNATFGSMISQTTSAVSGDSFIFNWNFVEHDYLPYDDWAFYAFSIDGGPAQVTKFASLDSVGPTTGTTVNGWEQVTFDITQDGDYTFYFGVVNAVDNGLPSALWVDGLTGTGTLETRPTSVAEPASLVLFSLSAFLIGVSRRRKTL